MAYDQNSIYLLFDYLINDQYKLDNLPTFNNNYSFNFFYILFINTIHTSLFIKQRTLIKNISNIEFIINKLYLKVSKLNLN